MGADLGLSLNKDELQFSVVYFFEQMALSDLLNEEMSSIPVWPQDIFVPAP